MGEETELHQRIARSHQARQLAESFGVDPGRYDRARPSYPQAMVERILASTAGRDVVDVGIGTGIAARQFEAAGCRVLGVEVDARMAEFARQRGSQVEVAAFERWEPAGRLFDLLIAGQTWHWVDPVAGAVKAAEVLRPGGRVAVFWNALEPPPELAGVFAEGYRAAMPPSTDLPSSGTGSATAEAGPAIPMSAAEGYSLMVAKAAAGLGEVGGFSAMEEWRFDWDRSYTRDEWLDQLPTSGGLTSAPAEQLEPLLARIGAAIDSVGGSFQAHYTTVVGTATRVPAGS